MMLVQCYDVWVCSTFAGRVLHDSQRIQLTFQTVKFLHRNCLSFGRNGNSFSIFLGYLHSLSSFLITSLVLVLHLHLSQQIPSNKQACTDQRAPSISLHRIVPSSLRLQSIIRSKSDLHPQPVPPLRSRPPSLSAEMERRIAPTAIRCPRVVCLLMPSLPSTKMAVLNASSSGY